MWRNLPLTKLHCGEGIESELQTHTVTEAGKDLQDHGVQPLAEHHHVNKTAALSATSSYFLKMSMGSGCTWAAHSNAKPHFQ